MESHVQTWTWSWMWAWTKHRYGNRIDPLIIIPDTVRTLKYIQPSSPTGFFFTLLLQGIEVWEIITLALTLHPAPHRWFLSLSVPGGGNHLLGFSPHYAKYLERCPRGQWCQGNLNQWKCSGSVWNAFHRISNWFVSDGTFKNHLVQLSCCGQGHLSL